MATFICLALLSFPGFAADAPQDTTDANDPEHTFKACIANLDTLAQESGVSDATRTAALAPARYRSDVIGYDRNQPEFVQTFPNYLTKRVNDWRIQKGREMLAKHKTLLASLTRRYGVPAHYLIAFWGLETNFGSYKGKMPIVDSLATLACDPRRSEFFTRELMNALILIDRERIEVKDMVGSWAGAMGHTQFMPSAYLAYAVDGDGDGRADLWNSEIDALTSAANFLRHLGWQSGFRWGREVLLPDNFDYQLIGRGNPNALSVWDNLGVVKTDKSTLGQYDIKASVVLPTGHKGPAFLVYDNFDVILKWNNSESYAIAVGYLADRIVGKPELHSALPDLPDMAITDMKQLQSALNLLGFDVGTADGILGPATRSGVRSFQVSTNMIADGFPDTDVFNAVKQAATEQGIDWEGLL